ncbi:MAG: O-antigen polymerase [Lachnospiraceae bacterium]
MIPYILAMTMIGLLIVFFYAYNQEMASPVVAFLVPFSLATIDLIYNIDKWKVDLQWNTYVVIVGGTLAFLVACSFIKSFGESLRGHRGIVLWSSPSRLESKVEPVFIPKLNYIFFAVLQGVTFLLCLNAVITIARRYGVSGSVSALIAGYKNLKTFTTDNISLGKLNNIFYDFCYASGYVWFYILAKNYVASKKIEKWAVINLVLSIAIALEKGSRGGAVALICSGASMFILFWQQNSKKGKLSFKQIIGIIFFAALVVGTFQKTGELLGRVSTADFEGYLAVYLSAPIRNLDYFLRQNITAPDIFGKMTFVRMINYLGGKLNIMSWVYELDLPPLHANGFVTGNVYTTFYAYIYDFGYLGVPIMMFIMGVVSQMFYQKAKALNSSRHIINIWVLLYADVFYLLAFSFFSNKFYEGIVAIQFFKYILYWLIIRCYLERVRFKIY